MKSVKNNLGSKKIWHGQEIEPGGTYTVQNSEVEAWEADTHVIASISSGELAVNDGSSLLSISEGIAWFSAHDAQSIRDVVVDDSAKGNGKLLSYKSSTNRLVYVAPTAISRIIYPLVSNSVTINFGTYQAVASALWLNSRNSNFTTGTVCFYVTLNILTNTLDLRLMDVTHSTALGSISATTTGFYTFTVSNPSSDARLELQARNVGVGTVPTLVVATLEYN